MPRSRHVGFGRVNLIKKVKVDGAWKFCPAVVEPNRRLNDKVRVNGQIEIHPEGAYYLEWRDRGKRRRQPVHNRALIFEQARLKALELETQRNGHECASPSTSPASNTPLTGKPEPLPPLSKLYRCQHLTARLLQPISSGEVFRGISRR